MTIEKTHHIHCQRVDHSSDDFARTITQNLVNGKLSVIVNIPDNLDNVINTLFHSGDIFFDGLKNINAEDYPQVFVPNGVSGLYQSTKDKNLCCNNGVRFFMTTDQSGFISNQNIPCIDGQEVMKNAAMSFCNQCDSIVTQILREIEHHFNYESNSLVQTMGTANVSLTRYYPTTRASLLQMHQEDLLYLDDNNPDKVILLDEHFDSNLITLVCYRSGSQGVEFLQKNEDGKEEYMALNIPDHQQFCLLIVPGIFLSKLTNNLIPSFSHRVVTTSEEQKMLSLLPSQQSKLTLGYNKWYRFPTISPLMNKAESTKDFSQVMQSLDYLNLNMDRVLVNRNRHRVKKIPADLLKNYPLTIDLPVESHQAQDTVTLADRLDAPRYI